MDRLDGQGFHPTVRPFHPHRKKERNKIKVFRKATPQAWQLAMMRVGMGFVTNEEDRVELGKLIESGVFDLEGTTLLAPMCGGEISCGSAGDYSITQADPSRPPPKQDVLVEENEFVSCEQTTENITATSCNHRKTHRLQKYLFRVLFMTLPFMATAIMAISCHKEPYDVVIDWDWNNPPDKELVRQYAHDKNIRTIILNLRPFRSDGFSPNAFHRARDSVEINFFSISPYKVIGSGNIYVDEINGAQLPYPCGDGLFGMYLIDSIYYTGNGFGIVRGRPPANSK